jgi:regulator of protease activity HflC (stomatin/prohibitin superfamily)
MTRHRLKRLAAVLVLGGLFMTGCRVDEIPPGNKGFMFDRTGAFALYTGGDGLETDHILGPGSHYTGIYDQVKDVDCKDSHMREEVSVLTKSDINVIVDVRITYAANCDSKESISRILDEVPTDQSNTVKQEALYDLYILPVVRESLRNRLATVTIEDVKNVRTELRDGIHGDLDKAIGKTTQPVKIKVLTVSDIKLPKEIVEKNRMIELARQDAEQEREKQEAAKHRLRRELFEAQKEREVQKELAEKEKDVAIINAQRDKEVRVTQAEAELEARMKEAEGINTLRKELTGNYVEYYKVKVDAEVRGRMADSMIHGTKWYVGKDFLIPPDGGGKVSVSVD